MTRHRLIALACVLGLMAACSSNDKSATTSAGSATPTSVQSANPAQEAQIAQIVDDMMKQTYLRSVIIRATVDGKDIVTKAVGESMTGVPATTDMHFRIGAVAISHVATLLFMLVEEKKVSLDDKVSKWLPDLPNGDRVNLGQLAQMTSGYADYVQSPDLIAAHYADPFRHFQPEELIAYAKPETLLYDPGTNWNYAHTDYVILGLALEKITGQPLAKVLKERVLDPLGMKNTVDPGTPAITEPVLHAFTSERRGPLEVPVANPFYEESTFWDPSWSINRGAIDTSNIYDMLTSVVGVGSGKLLSQESYRKMIAPDLRGKTTLLPGCKTCLVQDDFVAYGYGTYLTGDWLKQSLFLSGYAGVASYLPSQKVGIAVEVTYDQAAYEHPDIFTNQAEEIFRKVGALLAPSDPPPVKS